MVVILDISKGCDKARRGGGTPRWAAYFLHGAGREVLPKWK
jgi:hypothetical protein